MIDRVLCVRSGEDIFHEDYSSNQVISGYEHRNVEADSLAVIFGPWHGGGRITQRLINRLISQGNSVLTYDFHGNIIEPNADRVLESYDFLRKKVGNDLRNLKDEYKSIHLVGISLGNVAMAVAADEFQDFSGATFVVAGSNLASAMWDGIRTQGIARVLSEQDITKDELDQAWRVIAPVTHAKAFKGKTVTAHISIADDIIPTAYQLEMASALEDSGASLASKYSRLGHVATVTRFCVAQGRI